MNVNHLKKLSGTLILSVILFTGCLKEGDETVVVPYSDGKIPYSVIPERLQDSLTRHGFVIHEGTEPPSIEGRYVASPNVLQYASDNYANLFHNIYMAFAGQNPRGLIQYAEEQDSLANGKSLAAHIIGSDNSFTMYCYQELSDTVNHAWECKTATVVSGNHTPSGIASCQYAFIMLDKKDSADRLVPVGTFRIFHDSDLMASKL